MWPESAVGVINFENTNKLQALFNESVEYRSQFKEAHEALLVTLIDFKTEHEVSGRLPQPFPNGNQVLGAVVTSGESGRVHTFHIESIKLPDELRCDLNKLTATTLECCQPATSSWSLSRRNVCSLDNIPRDEDLGGSKPLQNCGGNRIQKHERLMRRSWTKDGLHFADSAVGGPFRTTPVRGAIRLGVEYAVVRGWVRNDPDFKLSAVSGSGTGSAVHSWILGSYPTEFSFRISIFVIATVSASVVGVTFSGAAVLLPSLVVATRNSAGHFIMARASIVTCAQSSSALRA
ncbi:hypothetical protein EVAR_28900_1 [Eumeta japonica]|uniref:Uncharacterized protein n=1 Tax=Eumeta variegata TaxID=151549 RepID=A0A4C1WZP1_EUMVA|nr:hypothetical protein EVAR_28900_1 [Eumeta japonica]